MIDNLLKNKMRAHQIEGASFILECLKGKAQVKSKKKKTKEADAEEKEGEEEDDDFAASPRSVPSSSPKSEKKNDFFGCLMCDEMGLGKTLQAIAVMQAFVKQKSKRGIIVCPSSLVENWRNEIRKVRHRVFFLSALRLCSFANTPPCPPSPGHFVAST